MWLSSLFASQTFKVLYGSYTSELWSIDWCFQCIVVFAFMVDLQHSSIFRDGPQETARKLGVFTDGEPNDPPSSTSNQVLIRFRSNTEKGGLFRISYQGLYMVWI